MSLQLLGALLILLSGSFLGWIIALQYLERIKQLKELQSAIDLFNSEIRYTQPILHQALARTAKKLDKPISILFLEAAESLSQKKGHTFNDIWQQKLNNNFKNNYLLKQDKDILQEWGQQIGSSDLEGQRNINKLTLKKLEKLIEQAEVEAEKKVKLIRYSGFLISLTIIILLY